MQSQQIPQISVGIISSSELLFAFQGEFRSSAGLLEGDWKATFAQGKIHLSDSHGNSTTVSDEFEFQPVNQSDSHFTINNVVIGVDFHWERREDQSFMGGLKIIVENGLLTAINVLSIEDYLISVISSEMSATSSTELLRAHAVISRSWLIAQIEKNKSLSHQKEPYQSLVETEEEHIKWYDREDHDNFDVCADDHCQRYQGITRASTDAVVDAVNGTRGEILANDGQICDARFSKCCGGKMEVFENVWEPVHHSYLQPRIDNPENPPGYSLDLTIEEQARAWILGNPAAYCNTQDPEVLTQVLNDYDQETQDFFRWKVNYSQEEVSQLIKDRIGLDVGQVEEFIPVERGASGRLIKLKIVGSNSTKIIGKELEIRKALSKSHLFSSAIVIEKQSNGSATSFEITGAGWGHGVGLCQIGAAVMGHKGYSYQEILAHYFPGAELEKSY